MSDDSAFLKTEATLAWLSQFEIADEPVAVELLKAITLVSRDVFAERLLELLKVRFLAEAGPIGLYVERELNHRKGEPHRLFKESRTKVRRAYGIGPRPVLPVRAYDADVGSEGIVAQLVSQLCREHPRQFLNHPGPDEIRERRVRRFVVVTDFIGSGKRVERYIQAAWRVRSVRSWWSAKARCGLRFDVVAYATTQGGQLRVTAHRARPSVHVVVACPTIDTRFASERRRLVVELCERYAPSGADLPALGFDGTGALIAFAHGAPNNTPTILHKGSRSWIPLFPARVTTNAGRAFISAVTVDSVQEKLLSMRQARLARAMEAHAIKDSSRNILLLLAAAARPPRRIEVMAQRTGLTMIELEEALAKALVGGWIDSANRLTDSGHAELAQARRMPMKNETVSFQRESYYCPVQLRAPSSFS